MSETFEPGILAFLRDRCSHAGADLAGVSRFQYPPNIRVMRTMCSGRVDPTCLVEGLKSYEGSTPRFMSLAPWRGATAGGGRPWPVPQ